MHSSRTPWSRADRFAQRERAVAGWALIGTARAVGAPAPLALQWLRATERAQAVADAWTAYLTRRRLPVVPTNGTAYHAALAAAASVENRALHRERMRRAREIVASLSAECSDTTSMLAKLTPEPEPVRSHGPSVLRTVPMDPARRDAFLYLSGLLTAPKAGE